MPRVNVPTVESDPKQAALTLANHFAPSGVEQKAFVDMVHTMEKEGFTPNEVITHVLCGILDGLKYGNWPQGK